MKILDIMKVLTQKGVSTSIHYNVTQGLFYIDLETKAKSDLYL
jgi:hypothetical protein